MTQELKEITKPPLAELSEEQVSSATTHPGSLGAIRKASTDSLSSVSSDGFQSEEEESAFSQPLKDGSSSSTDGSPVQHDSASTSNSASPDHASTDTDSLPKSAGSSARSSPELLAELSESASTLTLLPQAAQQQQLALASEPVSERLPADEKAAEVKDINSQLRPLLEEIEHTEQTFIAAIRRLLSTFSLKNIEKLPNINFLTKEKIRFFLEPYRQLLASHTPLTLDLPANDLVAAQREITKTLAWIKKRNFQAFQACSCNHTKFTDFLAKFFQNNQPALTQTQHTLASLSIFDGYTFLKDQLLKEFPEHASYLQALQIYVETEHCEGRLDFAAFKQFAGTEFLAYKAKFPAVPPAILARIQQISVTSDYGNLTIVPVQRFPRYKLFLVEINKYIGDNYNDSAEAESSRSHIAELEKVFLGINQAVAVNRKIHSKPATRNQAEHNPLEEVDLTQLSPDEIFKFTKAFLLDYTLEYLSTCIEDLDTQSTKSGAKKSAEWVEKTQQRIEALTKGCTELKRSQNSVHLQQTLGNMLANTALTERRGVLGKLGVVESVKTSTFAKKLKKYQAFIKPYAEAQQQKQEQHRQEQARRWAELEKNMARLDPWEPLEADMTLREQEEEKAQPTERKSRSRSRSRSSATISFAAEDDATDSVLFSQPNTGWGLGGGATKPQKSKEQKRSQSASTISASAIPLTDHPLTRASHFGSAKDQQKDSTPSDAGLGLSAGLGEMAFDGKRSARQTSILGDPFSLPPAVTAATNQSAWVAEPHTPRRKAKSAAFFSPIVSNTPYAFPHSPSTEEVKDLAITKTADEIQEKAIAAVLAAAAVAHSSWKKRLTDHFIWHSIIRPLLIAGLFTMLGIGLFANSLLAESGGLLMTGLLANPLWSISLAAIGLAILTQLVVRWLKQQPVATTANQALAAAIAAEEILQSTGNGLSKAETNALISHIQKLLPLLNPQGEWRKKLKNDLSNQWEGGLKYPGGPNTATADFNTLVGILNSANGTKIHAQIIAKREQLNAVLSRVVGNGHKNPGAIIDPTYKPPLTALEKKLPWLGGLLLAGCVAIIDLIFSGTILTLWLLPLAVGLGFFAAIAIRHYLNRTSYGPYGQWTAIFGIATLVFALLALSTFHLELHTLSQGVALASLSQQTAVIIGIILFVVTAIFYHISLRYTAKDAEGRAEARKNRFYRGSDGALSLVKVAVILGCLFLTFLSIAALFNLSNLGPFSNLMDYAFSIAVQSMQYDGYTIGAEWFGAFSVVIFSAASFIAFELTKDLLQLSPTSAADLKNQTQSKGRQFISYAGQFIFIAGIILSLFILSAKGAFMVGNTALFLPFTILAIGMPLFSGNINFFKKFNALKFNTLWNKWLGVTRHDDYRITLLREFLIGLALLAAPIILAIIGESFVTKATALILGIGAAVTIAIRLVTQLWDTAPLAIAEKPLQLTEIKLEDFGALRQQLITLLLQKLSCCIDQLKNDITTKATSGSDAWSEETIQSRQLVLNNLKGQPMQNLAVAISDYIYKKSPGGLAGFSDWKAPYTRYDASEDGQELEDFNPRDFVNDLSLQQMLQCPAARPGFLQPLLLEYDLSWIQQLPAYTQRVTISPTTPGRGMSYSSIMFSPISASSHHSDQTDVQSVEAIPQENPDASRQLDFSGNPDEIDPDSLISDKEFLRLSNPDEVTAGAAIALGPIPGR